VYYARVRDYLRFAQKTGLMVLFRLVLLFSFVAYLFPHIKPGRREAYSIIATVAGALVILNLSMAWLRTRSMRRR
jgi:hypothetical protein